MKFKIDFLFNFKGGVVRIFSGDVVEEHSEAIKMCVQTTGVDLPRKTEKTPRGDVVVFPYGGFVLPQVRHRN